MKASAFFPPSFREVSELDFPAPASLRPFALAVQNLTCCADYPGIQPCISSFQLLSSRNWGRSLKPHDVRHTPSTPNPRFFQNLSFDSMKPYATALTPPNPFDKRDRAQFLNPARWTCAPSPPINVTDLTLHRDPTRLVLLWFPFPRRQGTRCRAADSS